MTTARAKCNFCEEFVDGFETPDGDTDAAIAGAKALRERLIAHFETAHPEIAVGEAHASAADDDNTLEISIMGAPAAAAPSWCFTFGCGSPLSRYYVEIDAEDELQARCRMNALFSRHWASVYPREGFDRQIAEYNLLRLEVNKSGSVRLGTNPDEIDLDVYRRAFPWT
jgi:hypothetical protein